MKEKQECWLFVEFKSKNPMKINSCLYKLIKANSLKVKTITTDNGIEFEKIGILSNWIDSQVYYVKHILLIKRESNEHLMELLECFIKKGFDFSTLSYSSINHMSWEIFNWKSSQDLYEYENNRMF